VRERNTRGTESSIVRPRLICIDYIQKRLNGKDNMIFVFDAGVLSNEVIGRIQLPHEELSEFRIVEIDDAMSLLGERTKRRLPYCLNALHNKEFIYLET
jgi:hypothetical protein